MPASHPSASPRGSSNPDETWMRRRQEGPIESGYRSGPGCPVRRARCRSGAFVTNKYCFLVLEVINAWIDPSVKRSRTLHHLGWGAFMVAGRTIKLPSKMK